jgi:hypothetical protein
LPALVSPFWRVLTSAVACVEVLAFLNTRA